MTYVKISAAMFIILADCFLTTLLLPCNHGVQGTQTNDFLLFFYHEMSIFRFMRNINNHLSVQSDISNKSNKLLFN